MQVCRPTTKLTDFPLAGVKNAGREILGKSHISGMLMLLILDQRSENYNFKRIVYKMSKDQFAPLTCFSPLHSPIQSHTE